MSGDLPRAGDGVPPLGELRIDAARPLERPTGLDVGGVPISLTEHPMPGEPLVLCEGYARGTDGFDYAWEVWAAPFYEERGEEADAGDESPVVGEVASLGDGTTPAVVRRVTWFTQVVVPQPSFDLGLLERMRAAPPAERALIFSRRAMRYDDFLDLADAPGFDAEEHPLSLIDAIVLSCDAQDGELRFEIDAPLYEGHPEYRPPPPEAVTRRQRRAHRSSVRLHLRFPGFRDAVWDPPADLGAGPPDLVGLKAHDLSWDGRAFELTGEWGAVRIRSDAPRLARIR